MNCIYDKLKWSNLERERGSRSKERGKSLLIYFLLRIDQLNSWEKIFLNWKSKRTFLAVKTDNYDIFLKYELLTCHYLFDWHLSKREIGFLFKTFIKLVCFKCPLHIWSATFSRAWQPFHGLRVVRRSCYLIALWLGICTSVLLRLASRGLKRDSNIAKGQFARY